MSRTTQLATALVTAVIATGLCSPAARAADKADFYVSPQGNDAWSGRLAEPNAAKTDGPLATVAPRAAGRARVEAEGARPRAADRRRRPRRDVLPRPSRFEFGPDDSGTEKAPVVYAGVTARSGRSSAAARRSRAGRSAATAAGSVDAGRREERQVVVRATVRQRPAALPPAAAQAGLLQDRRAACRPAEAPRSKGHDRFGYSGDDLRADWANRGDVEVLAFHQWTASRMRIAAIDAAEARRHVHRHHARHEPLGLVPQGAPLPGGERPRGPERAGPVVSRPAERTADLHSRCPARSRDKAVVIAPRLERLVTFEGDVKGRRWVAAHPVPRPDLRPHQLDAAAGGPELSRRPK